MRRDPEPRSDDNPGATQPSAIERTDRAPLVRPWRSALIAIATSALVLALSWWALERSPGRMPAWEGDLFNTVNHWPDAIRLGLWPVMQPGSFWVVIVGSVAAFLIWRRRAPALTVALATWSAWLLARAIKEVVGRDRPEAYLAAVHVRDDAIGYGFVSGHAAIAFALATALAPWLGDRRLIVLAYALATVVAVSRVYVGVHLPLDVIGGAAAGVLCGSLAQLVVGVPDGSSRTSRSANPTSHR